MSNRSKLNVSSLADMTQINIEMTEGTLTYGELLFAKVKELFDADLSESKILIGVDIGNFKSRREEGQFFLELHKAGHKYQVVSWPGKSSVFTGVLIDRANPELVGVLPVSSSVLGP